jgi:hypothetical protein
LTEDCSEDITEQSEVSSSDTATTVYKCTKEYLKTAKVAANEILLSYHDKTNAFTGLTLPSLNTSDFSVNLHLSVESDRTTKSYDKASIGNYTIDSEPEATYTEEDEDAKTQSSKEREVTLKSTFKF